MTETDANPSGGVWTLWQWVVVRPPPSVVVPFLLALVGPFLTTIVPFAATLLSLSPPAAALAWSAVTVPIGVMFPWAQILRDYMPADTFGQLRVADDGVSVWLGLNGSLLVWTAAAWAAALPAFAFVIPQPQVAAAVWLIGLAAVLLAVTLQQALNLVAMRYPLVGAVVGFGYVFAIAAWSSFYLSSATLALSTVVARLASADMPLLTGGAWSAAGLALTAAIQLWCGWFFSNVETTDFGFLPKDQQQKRLKASFAALTRSNKTSRPSRRWAAGRWWAGRPLTERAFRESMRSTAGTMAFTAASIAAVVVIVNLTFMRSDSNEYRYIRIFALQFGQFAVGVTIFRLAAGPLIALHRERIEQTLGLLTLAHGLRTTVRQITTGVLLAVAVGISPMAVGVVALFWDPTLKLWVIAAGVLIPSAVGLFAFLASWSFYWVALPATEEDSLGRSPSGWVRAAGEAGMPKWMLASILIPPLLLAGPYYAWKNLAAREPGG